MSLFAPDEFDAFLATIRELHSFGDFNSLCSWLLDSALPHLIPSDWYSFNEVDLVNPANTVAILRPEASNFFKKLLPRFQELAYQHPLITRQMKLADFPVHKISDFLSQKSFHELGLYQEVYRHMGVEFQIAATIKLAPDHVTAIALSRRQTDYTERDRAILGMLRPHLVIAFNNLALAREYQFTMDTAALALNECSSATLIVDTRGQILYHTGPGLDWIGHRNGGNLPARIVDWLPLASLKQPHPTMKMPSEAGVIHIRAVPTNNKERLLLVLTLEKERPLLGAPINISQLSQRESEVADWICQGKTNAEIAGILGISPRTVHKHLENIYNKLGVETRLALAQSLRL